MKLPVLCRLVQAASIIVLVFVTLYLFYNSGLIKKPTKEDFQTQVKVMGKDFSVGDEIAIVDAQCHCGAVNKNGCLCANNPDTGKVQCNRAGVEKWEKWEVKGNDDAAGVAGTSFADWNKDNKRFEAHHYTDFLASRPALKPGTNEFVVPDNYCKPRS